MWINLPGLAGLWTNYKPAMFWGRFLKDSCEPIASYTLKSQIEPKPNIITLHTTLFIQNTHNTIYSTHHILHITQCKHTASEYTQQMVQYTASCKMNIPLHNEQKTSYMTHCTLNPYCLHCILKTASST